MFLTNIIIINYKKDTKKLLTQFHHQERLQTICRQLVDGSKWDKGIGPTLMLCLAHKFFFFERFAYYLQTIGKLLGLTIFTRLKGS